MLQPQTFSDGKGNIPRREDFLKRVNPHSEHAMLARTITYSKETFEMLQRMLFILLLVMAVFFIVATGFCLGYGYGPQLDNEDARKAGWVMLAFATITLAFSYLIPYVFLSTSRIPFRAMFNIQDTPQLP